MTDGDTGRNFVSFDLSKNRFGSIYHVRKPPVRSDKMNLA